MRQGTGGVVGAVRRAAGTTVVAACGLLALAVPMGMADGEAAAALPTLSNDFSATVSVTGTPDGAVSSIELKMDDTHQRASATFLDAAGDNLGTLYFFFDKAREYLYVPSLGAASDHCGLASVPTGAMTEPFGWLDDGDASQLPSGAFQAANPSSVLTSSYVFYDVLSVMGDPATAGPLDLTVSGQAPEALTVGQAVGTATLKFSGFTAGEPDASDFVLPLACLSTTQPGITQFPPTSATISYGSAFSAQLQADAYPYSPVTYTTTASSPLSVSPEGVVSAPGAPPAPGIYSVSGTDTDTLGDAGAWSFTLTVLPGATNLVAKPAGHLLAIHPTFSATLSRASDRAPIAGRKVSFTYRGRALCTAVTGINGVASCHYPGIDIFLERSEFTATFAGDADYLGSTGQAPV